MRAAVKHCTKDGPQAGKVTVGSGNFFRLQIVDVVMDQSLSEQIGEAWRRHHAYLVNLGYQITGDVGDAEDVAQEAFLRLSRAEPTEIDDIRGWLTVVASRLCLDHVRSARARYERPGDMASDAMLVESRRPDPAERITLDDEVRGALLEVLRRLSPGERVAFVLHDVFGVPFDSIAETVGRPVGTCRQLARRARANGDIAALTAVLDPTVWGVGTILVDPPLPPQVNHGPHDVATNLLRYLGPGATLVSAPVGRPVVLAFDERRLFAVIVLTVRDRLIGKIEATADPSARASMPGA
jgi:RNA polymerase sigma-70 factor, ECF subfamily